MATGTTTESEFGEVSRIKGLVFEQTTLAASLLGIVALTILLGYVTIDAFGLDHADGTWFGVYAATVVLPAALLAGYGVRNRDFARVSLGALLRLFGGVAGGLAILVLFLIADSQLWFLYHTFAVLPTVAVLLYGRRTGATWATFPTPNVVFVLGSALAFLVKGPLDTYPTTWLIYLWTIAVPAGSLVGYLLWRDTEDRTRSVAVAAAVVVASAVGSLLVEFAGFGVDRTTGLVFILTLLTPTTFYVARTLRRRDEGRLGLLTPVAVAAGLVVGSVLVDALGAQQPEPWLDWQYLTSAPSRFPEQAGLYPAVIGSVFIISLVALLSFVLGVATAIYLEEYAPTTGALGSFTRIVQVNISNLAGVPSVVYGLLGLGVFVNLLNMGLGTVVVAAITLSLLILPIVIISSQEAIRSVPNDLRQASYGMGATRWQTVRNVVIPHSLPGVLTGTILALGRAIGETAPLILIGVPTTMFAAPEGLFSRAMAMPMQIFAWATFPQEEFRYGVVAAGVVTLLAVLLTINSVAILVRNNYQRSS